MPPDPLLILREVNHNLRSALDRFHPQSTVNSVATPQEFSALTADLLRAGECLKNLEAKRPVPGSLNSVEANALTQETNAYRANLDRLKLSLPDIHARLLAEKARLQTAEKHIAAAASWARANDKAF
jgi:hypothetical protein